MGEENTQNILQDDDGMIQFDPIAQDQADHTDDAMKNMEIEESTGNVDLQPDLDLASDVVEGGNATIEADDMITIDTEEVVGPNSGVGENIAMEEAVNTGEEVSEIPQQASIEQSKIIEEVIQPVTENMHVETPAEPQAQSADDMVAPVAPVAAPTATATSTQETKEAAPTEKRTIMVVEDDMFISDIYDVKLTAAGYNVISANNGRDALEKLNAGADPHLMLLDIVMPYMDGFDVLEALSQKEEFKKIPIVLLTNLSQKEDIDRAMNLGASDYLIKSHFTPSEVLSKVEKYIRKD